MSKKVFLGGAAAVVAAFAVSPYFTGSVVESQVKAQVAALDSQPAYDAKLVDFQSGYLSSEGTILVTVKLGNMTDDGMELPEEINAEFQLSAQHGLLLTKYDAGIGLASWKLELVDDKLREYLEWSDGDALYHMTGSLGLFGGGEYRDRIAKFNVVENGDGVAVNFTGYQGRGAIDSDNIEYGGGFEQFKLATEGGARVDLKDMKFDINAETPLEKLLKGSVYEGESSLSIAQFYFEDKTMEQPLVLSNYQMNTRSDIGEDEVNASMSVAQTLESLTSSVISVNDIALDISMDNLNIEVLEAFQKLAANQDATAHPEVLLEEQKEFFVKRLIQFAEAEPSLKIDALKASFEQGDMNADMMMQLAAIDKLPQPIDNQVFWLSHVNSDANLSIDKPLATWLAEKQILMQLKNQLPPTRQDPEKMQQLAEQQAPLIISALIQQGFITEQDDAYVSKFTLQDGKFVLNGNELPIMQALQQ